MTWAKSLRALAWFHRWTGVGLCLLFALWFASGAVLAFVPFPALPDSARTASSERIALSTVRISPAAAMRIGSGRKALRLVSAAGRPVYLVTRSDGVIAAVAADTGEALRPFTAEQAGKIAGAFAGANVTASRGPFNYDQWVVHQKFDPWRPFYRVSLADGEGTQLYVSARTGEVVQRTRAAERAWNWVGAVSHWLYFTALRQSFFAWDQTVWWVSLLGVTTAAAGIWLGVYRTQNRLRGRRPDWSPFRGWMRWHHGFGLGAALFVLTWIFSGWLSMDHGRLFSRGTPPAVAEARYHGAALDAALAPVRLADLTSLNLAGEIIFNVVGGHPVAAAGGGSPGARVLLLDQPSAAPLNALPTAVLVDAAAAGWPLGSRTPHGPETDDALYRAAEGMADRAVRFPLAAPSGGSIYLDPVNGRVLVLMDTSRKAYAWVYYALHTLKFPGLIERPILRRVLELVPLTAGFIFSVTGLVVAVKRLRVTAQ
jgi:hypothetical protein